jgi:hypothetical protein
MRKGNGSVERHLHFDHGMSEVDYRARWGLSPGHPLFAPAIGKAKAEDGWGFPAEALRFFGSRNRGR